MKDRTKALNSITEAITILAEVIREIDPGRVNQYDRVPDMPCRSAPVGWQWRFKDGSWSKWINIEGDLDDFKRCQRRGLAKGSVETRAIYATPSPTAATEV